MANMDNACYSYNGQLWRSCPTKSDNNSFFHSAFGTRDQEGEAYFDKHAQFRRMRWATFLTYFANEIMPSSLADILKKCFSANDKYKHFSIDDKVNFMKYVSDIISSERNVMTEEIPILTTLENIKIIVFSRASPDKVITIKPNPGILGSYPNVEIPKEEVVLCMKRDIFSKLEPIKEDVSSTPDEIDIGNEIVEENITPPRNNFGKYKKGGSAGSKGVQYQVNLLVMVLLNAFKNLREWKLSTENVDAGKFDDIVLEQTEGAIFIQAKHKESKRERITLDELISTNSKNDDFSIPKYFLSYLQIKTRFKIKNVIICTNTNVHKRALRFLDLKESHSGNILHYEKNDYSFYMLKYEALPDLKESVKNYYQLNYKNKGIQESAINDKNLKDFQEHLQLYFNYPSLNRMEKTIDKSLSLIKCCNSSRDKIFSSDIYSKMMEWYQQKGGTYLTQSRAIAMFCEIRREKFCQELEQYEVSFPSNDLNFQLPVQIFHVTTDGRYLLQVIKVYRGIQDDKTKILFVNLDDDIDIQKQVVEAFGLPEYTFLIIIWPQTTKKSGAVGVFGKLKDILDKSIYKKIIVVAEGSNRFVQQIGKDRDIVRVSKPVTFEDFQWDFQERLLKKKNIVFQGNNVSLEDILEEPKIGDYGRALDTEILEKLVRGEEVKVGLPPSQLDECIGHYYISRMFRRKLDKTQDEKWIIGEIDEISLEEELYSDQDKIWSNEMKEEESFPEENIYDVNEKVVVISDSAGMGKSTVLAKLAVTIKENSPHLWVIRLELNQYTKILRSSLRNGKNAVNIIELINSSSATKLTNHLEEFVFSSRQKVVLMLDGLDEISPDYTGLILGLLKQCQKQPNFIKIFVTTRPDVTKELEEVLQVKPFILQPFTEYDQIDFLTNYWANNMQLKDHRSREKCKRYAKALISKCMHLNNDEGNHFATVPLQIRMMADIFQENTRLNGSANWKGCKEFILKGEAEPDMLERIDITELYDLFIKKKGHIFTEKANPTGNVVANQSVAESFNECLVYHRNLALEVILGEDRLHLSSSYQQVNKAVEMKMLKIGIVQKLDEKLHFIHRTFADYFLAECLLKELQQNPTLEFQMFLIDTIFLRAQYNVTRIFFDRFLQNVVDSLPSNIFEKYQSLKQESSLKTYTLQSYLIHILAREGCVAIIQLILKCIQFKTIKNKEITVTDSYKTYTDIDARKTMFGNTLNILQYHIRKAGINIKDKRGYTPLHAASKEGCIKMMKFLIERGANINVKSKFCHTVLHSASVNGHLDVIKYCIKMGANCNIKDSNGRIALHVAAQFGHLGVVKFLVQYCSNLKAACRYGRTLLHLSSRNGHLDTVRFLLELGVDPNIRDNYNCTSLHLAARYGQFDTLKFFAEYGLDFSATSSNGSTLLHGASVNGHLDVIKYLIKIGADFSTKDKNGCTALHVAAQFGQLETVKFFVEYSQDLNATCRYGRTLLHLSSMNGHTDVVRFLLELGVDCNIRDNFNCTALHLAVRYGQLDTVKSLKEYGLDFNIIGSNSFTLLHGASVNGHLDVIKYLIKTGADCGTKDSNGRAALHVAAQFGHLETVKFLVRYSPDLSAACSYGRTLLHLSSMNGHLDIVRFLLELSANTDIRDNNNCTPLHLAVRYGHVGVVRHLVMSGADLTIKDSNDFTALHLSAYYGQLDVVKLLVEYGLDFNVTCRYGRTILHLSSMNGHLETVGFLLELGVDFNMRDSFGNTPLHLAVRYGHVNTVRHLVVFGVDSTIRNNNGFTGLHMAAYFNQLNTVKAFVKCGLDFNVTSSDGSSLLHLASGKNHLDTIRYLLELGVDSTRRNNYGFTALHTAAYFGQLSTVKFFVEYGLDFHVTSGDGSSLLHLASEKGHLDMVKYLLGLSVDFNTKNNDGSVSLQMAAYYGQFNVVKFFVEYGLDFNITNSHGSTLLHLASIGGHLETVKYLIEVGVDPNIRDCSGLTALQAAICFNHLTIVKFFVEYGLDFKITSICGRTLLHSASEYGHMDIIKYILELGINFNVTDNEGYTALHLAAQYGHSTVVRLLVESGVDLNVISNNGRTVLHLASEYGHLDAVEFLLQVVEGNIRDNDGLTALHLAAQYGHLDTGKFLVNRGLDINATSSYGYTPLHLACENGHLDTVEFLLEAGADFKIRDGDGFVPLQTAAYFGQLDVVKFLIDYGLDFNVTSNYGCTILHSAGRNGHSHIVKFLLELSIDCSARNNSGYTALHLALQAGHLNVVKLFVEFGVDLNMKNGKGYTALHFAAFQGYLNIAKYLLKRKVHAIEEGAK